MKTIPVAVFAATVGGGWAQPLMAPPAGAPPEPPRFNQIVPGTAAEPEHYATVNADSEFTPPRGGVAGPGPAPMRLMLATSRDGLVFERKHLIVTDQGAVPDLVVDTNGWIWLYYQAWTAGDTQNPIALALSKDGGASWTFRRVRLDGFERPKPDPCDPEIQLLPDGTFRLYTTWPGRDGRQVTWLSESRDGVRFRRVGIAFDPGSWALDPSVLRIGDTWHLFAGGGRGPGENWHATSRDGCIFSNPRSMRFTAAGVDCMMANGIAVPGGWRFYAFNNKMPGQTHRITSFFTRDGTNWTADAGARLEAHGGLDSLEDASAGPHDPAIGRLKDGTYLMVYVVRIPGIPEPHGPERGLPPPPRRIERDSAPPRRQPERVEAFAPLGGVPPLARDVFVRIPCAAAGREGVAATVLIPREPRFREGAPVVIQVAGGVQAGNARGRPEYVGLGLVEIHFAFPGGGFGEQRSGGAYDFRGPNCIRALADVIRFATGRLADLQGRRIGELARDFAVLTNNVGLVGSSHGGNTCGLALALHGDEFPNLAWYASMESPYGEGAANVELGGHDTGLNPAYDPKTGMLDLSKLAWSPELGPGLARKPMPADPRKLKGAFYFDLDADGRFSADRDFPCNCFVGDAGSGVKAWYSPRILAEADRRKLIGGPRPAHVPTLAEAHEFWRYRDAAPHIPEAVRRCPELAVIVYANERDHVQADPAHTHIFEQVEGFRKAGCRFVRLNPDRTYVEHVAPAGPPHWREMPCADNPAGKTWTRANIVEGLEPEGLLVGVAMQAAVAELADRTQADQWDADLDRVLLANAPRPSLPVRGR